MDDVVWFDGGAENETMYLALCMHSMESGLASMGLMGLG